jgi:hypothetical protein
MDKCDQTPTPVWMRIPVITVLLCCFVVAAFAHMNLRGHFVLDDGDTDAQNGWFFHGWPHVFAERQAIRITNYTYQSNLYSWSSFRRINIKAATLDILLSLILCLATGVVIFRLERKLKSRFQFSIADILSFTVATAVILGLVRFEHSWIYDSPLHPYILIREFPYFVQAMLYLSLACTIALICSTIMDRLSVSTKMPDIE